MIGLAAVFMMATIGRITGISNIFASTLTPKHSVSWQWAFIIGLLLSGLLVQLLYQPITIEIESNTPMLLIAGLLVGFGTRLGSGCTSGHGICGLSRFSLRSLVATLSFMAAGFVTVLVTRHLMGGM